MSEVQKRVSWLELFYDLVFVALVAQFTYVVADLVWTPQAVFLSGLVGYMMFVAWWGTTVSRNFQDSETTRDRIWVQVQMVFALLMSIYLPDVLLGGSPVWFFVSYAVVRTIQIFLLFRSYKSTTLGAPQTHNVVQGYTIAVVLWVVAGFVASPFMYVVAGLALLLDILSPMTQGRGNRIRMLNVAHLQERLGLFLLLVMGESVLVVALSNTAVQVGLIRPLVVVAGIFYMIALWWLYFSHLQGEAEGKMPKNLFAYLHAHAFLFGSVVITAVAFKNLITDTEFFALNAFLLSAGSILMIFSLLVIRWMIFGVRPVRVWTSSASVIVFAVIGAVSVYFSSVVILVTASTAVMLVYAYWDECRRLTRAREVGDIYQA